MELYEILKGWNTTCSPFSNGHFKHRGGDALPL
jgi:hypothetical protein